jgi:hypothetical protein
MVVGGGFAGKLRCHETRKNNKNQCFIKSSILNHTEYFFVLICFLLCSVRKITGFSTAAGSGRVSVFVLLARGYVRSSLTPGYQYFAPMELTLFSTFTLLRPQRVMFFKLLSSRTGGLPAFLSPG